MTSPAERGRVWTVAGAGLLAGVFACTNDYDQFNFNGGSPADGGGTTVQNGGGGNPPTNGGGGNPPTNGGGGNPPTDGGGGMTTTDGGSTNQGGGGSPPVGDLPCGNGGPCAASCCIDEDGASNGTCAASCGAQVAELTCNEPSDCPGQECCLNIATNGDLEGTFCAGTCSDDTICSDSGDCGGGDCLADARLPDGYMTCQ
jgi:hypothetical protein